MARTKSALGDAGRGEKLISTRSVEHQSSWAKVRYASAAPYTASTPALVSSNVLTPPDGNGQGVQAEYFDNPDLQGQAKLRRKEPRVF